MKSKKFIPKIGQLVTRTRIDHDDGNIEMLLLFHDKNEFPNHYQSLARLRNGKTGPFFGGYIDDSGNEVEITEGGDVIVRSLVSWENLQLMAKTWNKKTDNVISWYAEVLRKPGLFTEEVARIKSAFNTDYAC